MPPPLPIVTIRLNPDFALPTTIGEMRSKSQYAAAIADYNSALRLNPNDTYAYNNRGLAKVDLGRLRRHCRL